MESLDRSALCRLGCAAATYGYDALYCLELITEPIDGSDKPKESTFSKR